MIIYHIKNIVIDLKPASTRSSFYNPGSYPRMKGSFTSQTILIFLNQWVNRECQGQWCKQSFFILKNTNQVKFEFNNIQKFPMSLAWIDRTIYDDISFSYAWGKAILCDLTDAAVLAVCLVRRKIIIMIMMMMSEWRRCYLLLLVPLWSIHLNLSEKC